MLHFKFDADDTLQDFQNGFDKLGPLDVVTYHQNRFRDTMLLGRAYAYTDWGGCSRPLVVHWRGRVDIPHELRQHAVALEIEQTIRLRCGESGGIVQRDIRSEARALKLPDVKQLVLEDIERGDLPNRFLFEQGLQQSLYEHVGTLYRTVGRDPEFDWQRVRVNFD